MENTVTVYLCTICGAKLTNKSNINRHMKKVHTFTSNYKNASLNCPLCNSIFPNYGLLDNHLSLNHEVLIKHNKLHFDSKEAFNEWKLNFEKQTTSYFCFYNSKKHVNNSYIKITKYICHRSGTYVTQQKGTKREREIKLKGSNKIGSHCPARIIASENNNGQIKVEIMETHVGHETEVGRLRLTKSEREDVAGKLFKGIPSHRILKDVGKTFNSRNRISYITNHDIHNIKKSFNVQSDVIFHQDDANSVNILIKKFQESLDNPILAYKPYGSEDQEIGDNNFFLIFMNSAQQKMLEEYGNNILMIDSTHNTNPYQIQLTTLMVVDSDHEGFPIALLWSKLQTENVYRKFFACLKEKVPNLKPKIFVSDDTNVFYNAFSKEFNYYPTKILCDWHVKKNLFENLSKITILEKRKEVKNLIYCLVNELDENTFDKMLKNITEKLLKDCETKRYGEYFQKYYACRSTQWAHCFKKGVHKNTNMSLEKWHQELKYNFWTKGKVQQRLDVSIANIIECIRQKFLKRLISLNRSKIPHKLSELRKRHKISQQIVDETDVYEDTPHCKWLVASSKNKTSNNLLHFYTVKKELDSNQPCYCNLKCTECNACIHMFSCDCHDYAIQFNMCKHIHLTCKKFSLKEETICNKSNCANEKEHAFITDHMEAPEFTDKLELKKKRIREKIEKLNSLIDKCENLEAIAHVENNIDTLLISTKVLSCENTPMPPKEKNAVNKNIVHQVRPFQKREKKTKRHKNDFDTHDNILLGQAVEPVVIS